MAKPTLLTIKNFVANQLGATDGATSSTIRDAMINNARRQYYSEHKWSFLLVPNTAITITNQLGPLPTDFNYTYDPDNIYTYTSNVKYEYTKQEYNLVPSFTQDYYAYAIDKNAGKIYINQTAISSVLMDYYRLPADAATDGSQDGVAEAVNDISAIAYLSIAYWWLASERATAKFQMFKDLYDKELAKDLQKDSRNQPVLPINGLPRSLGYNSRYKQFVPKGYIGVS